MIFFSFIHSKKGKEKCFQSKKKKKFKNKKKRKNSSEAGFEPTPRFQDVISSHTS